MARTNSEQNELEQTIVTIAQDILEEFFSAGKSVHAKPLFLKNRTLTITCSTPEMVAGIRENQQAIVSKINERLGKNEVDRIRYLA